MTYRSTLLRCLALPSFLLFLATGEARGADPAFLRGDVNADGKVSISDPLMLRRFLFTGGAPSTCMAAVDSTDDNEVNLTDVIWSLSAIFLGGTAFPAPFPEAGVDPTPGIPCDSYQVEPAAATEDVIRIGDVTASPGEAVEVPVYLTSTVEVEAVQLVVRYDPAAFTPEEGLQKGLNLEGTPWGPPLSAAFMSVSASAAEGIFVVGLIGSLTGVMHRLGPRGEFIGELFPPIPPGEDQLIFRIKGQIPPDAVPGTNVLLEPTNGPDGEGVQPPYFLRNELTFRGAARYVSFVPRTQPGTLGIVGDITLFSRGDANADRIVDITDALYVLGYLYLGGPTPSCLDADDADDNGEVELTDAVVILGKIFLGSPDIAAPYPAPGMDPTLDGLPCPQSSLRGAIALEGS